MNKKSNDTKPQLAPRHEHSFGVYKRYAPLLNAAIATGESYVDPMEVAKTGRMKPYTLVVALRAALAAKRKYFYKVGLPIDNTNDTKFKIRETTNGLVAIFYEGANITNYQKLRWETNIDQIRKILEFGYTEMEITASSDVESEIRDFVQSINPSLSITFQSEWLWKVEKVV